MRLTHTSLYTRTVWKRLRRELVRLSDQSGSGWTHFLDPARGIVSVAPSQVIR